MLILCNGILLSQDMYTMCSIIFLCITQYVRNSNSNNTKVEPSPLDKHTNIYHPNNLSTRWMVQSFNSWLSVLASPQAIERHVHKLNVCHRLNIFTILVTLKYIRCVVKVSSTVFDESWKIPACIPIWSWR